MAVSIVQNIVCWFAVTCPLAGVLIGCGASYQSLYEGDVRFEHCYALDTLPRVAPGAKLQCWSDWTHQYTVGQTRDRLDYALARQRSLLRGEDPGGGLVTERLALASMAPVSTVSPPPAAQKNTPNIACPVPATPYESPPATLAHAAPSLPSLVGTKGSPPAPPPSALSPTQTCVHDCGNHFTTCVTDCKKPGCVNRCGDVTKKCIAECL